MLLRDWEIIPCLMLSILVIEVFNRHLHFRATEGMKSIKELCWVIRYFGDQRRKIGLFTMVKGRVVNFDHELAMDLRLSQQMFSLLVKRKLCQPKPVPHTSSHKNPQSMSGSIHHPHVLGSQD